jgi:hypothetical protein
VNGDHDTTDDPDDVATERGERGRFRRVVVPVAVTLLVVFGLMQLVPYGWRHSNPPVVDAAPWPDAASERIARTSCYSCHSNETDWPWYSYVAPMSWLVRMDVDRGRDEFNFSDWDEGDADDAVEMIEEGSMPLSRYTMIHRDARLTDAERDTLVAALLAMGGDDRDRDD